MGDHVPDKPFASFGLVGLRLVCWRCSSCLIDVPSGINGQTLGYHDPIAQVMARPERELAPAMMEMEGEVASM